MDSISDADEVVSEALDYRGALGGLERRGVLSDEDCLFRLDEDTAVGLYTEVARTVVSARVTHGGGQ